MTVWGVYINRAHGGNTSLVIPQVKLVNPLRINPTYNKAQVDSASFTIERVVDQRVTFTMAQCHEKRVLAGDERKDGVAKNIL
jgi:hypothetical protein